MLLPILLSLFLISSCFLLAAGAAVASATGGRDPSRWLEPLRQSNAFSFELWTSPENMEQTGFLFQIRERGRTIPFEQAMAACERRSHPFLLYQDRERVGAILLGRSGRCTAISGLLSSEFEDNLNHIIISASGADETMRLFVNGNTAAEVKFAPDFFLWNPNHEFKSIQEGTEIPYKDAIVAWRGKVRTTPPRRSNSRSHQSL